MNYSFVFALLTDILEYIHPHAEKTMLVRSALTQPPIGYKETLKSPISANFPVHRALEDSSFLLISSCST